jgi:hypothetical protein
VKRSKRPTQTKPSMVLGFAWYREQDWPRVKRQFPDADELHDSYAEWLASAQAAMRTIRRSGTRAEPFVINLDDFLGWCAIRGREPDAKSRSEYVAEKLSARSKGQS